MTKNQKEKGTSLPAVCCGFVGRFELVFFLATICPKLATPQTLNCSSRAVGKCIIRSSAGRGKTKSCRQLVSQNEAVANDIHEFVSALAISIANGGKFLVAFERNLVSFIWYAIVLYIYSIL